MCQSAPQASSRPSLALLHDPVSLLGPAPLHSYQHTKRLQTPSERRRAAMLSYWKACARYPNVTRISFSSISVRFRQRILTCWRSRHSARMLHLHVVRVTRRCLRPRRVRSVGHLTPMLTRSSSIPAAWQRSTSSRRDRARHLATPSLGKLHRCCRMRRKTKDWWSFALMSPDPVNIIPLLHGRRALTTSYSGDDTIRQ